MNVWDIAPPPRRPPGKPPGWTFAAGALVAAWFAGIATVRALLAIRDLIGGTR